ncbi:MAG: hypothetical protein AB7F23_01820 [Phycisphaerae bacterium]
MTDKIKTGLENPYMSIELLPEFGAKLYSLRSKSSGRQWLWHNDRLPLAIPAYGDCYNTKLDSGGWDEIFPSVEPCELFLEGKRVSVPDHGELVSQQAEILALRDDSISTRICGKCADYTFERRLTLDGKTLKINYKVANRGDFPLPFIWSAHPLLRLDDDIRFVVNEDIELEAGAVFGDAPFVAGKRFGAVEFESVFSTSGVPAFAAKLFSKQGSWKWIAAVSSEAEEALVFHSYGAADGYLALWYNNFGWSGPGYSVGYRNVGIEPCSSPFDSLERAVETGNAPFVRQGDSAEWGLCAGLVKKDRHQSNADWRELIKDYLSEYAKYEK